MPKMRLGWYAGASTALAAGVVLSAFQQRANFYSAMVYLSQSNFCLLVLINFTLIVYGTFIFGISRLLFGQLRAVEVEQLTERAWFAITETCLAMTIFRDEIGPWFLVMFTTLVTGKVWGWISDGRVEFIEQQPPANPRLFHIRLSTSLALSFLYDVLILHSIINTVIQQARPNMMVMFLFEFAVLATTSGRTGLRYILSLIEQHIVHNQTQARLFERRQQIRQERETMIHQREAAAAAGEESESQEALPDEMDIDEMDIEVPGWASKGEWVLWLDLLTDMIKLCIYVVFFFMLLRFYGLPIHIMRDLLMTTRDFLKRLHAVLRYRRAIQEMNRYPDATVEELAQENTCIVCREEMRFWDPTNTQNTIDRVRPKKLPCGHILHLGCLKSWLERQQVCPTCRTPVSADAARPQNQNQNQNQGPNANQNQNRAGIGLRLQFGGGQAPFAANQPPANGDANMAQNNNGARGGQGAQGQDRVFNIGPLRLGFGARGGQFAPQRADMAQPAPAQAQDARNIPQQHLSRAERLQSLTNLISQASALVRQEIQTLNVSQQQLQIIELLMRELQRLDDAGQGNAQGASLNQLQAQNIQHQQQQQQQHPNSNQPTDQVVVNAQRALREAGFVPAPQSPGQNGAQQASSVQAYVPRHTLAQSSTGQASQEESSGEQSSTTQATEAQHNVLQLPGNGPSRSATPRTHSPSVLRHGATSYATAIPSGSSELPDGVTIPPGWTLMPLQRLDGHQQLHRQPRAPSAGPSRSPFGEGRIAQAAAQAPVQERTPSTTPASQLTTTANEPGATEEGPSSETRSATSTSNTVTEGSTIPSFSQGPTTGATAMAAPTPVMPSWGGPSQLFNGSAARLGTLQPASSTADDNSTSSVAPVANENGESSGSSGVANGTVPGEGQKSEKAAGKAVTVEEAEDEDA